MIAGTDAIRVNGKLEVQKPQGAVDIYGTSVAWPMHAIAIISKFYYSLVLWVLRQQ